MALIGSILDPIIPETEVTLEGEGLDTVTSVTIHSESGDTAVDQPIVDQTGTSVTIHTELGGLPFGNGSSLDLTDSEGSDVTEPITIETPENQTVARSVKVSGLSLLTTEDLRVEIVLGGTLTGASWIDPDDVAQDETAMEMDRSATAISGGTRIDGTLAAGGAGNRMNLNGIRALGVDIPDDAVVSLVALSMGNDATVSAAFTIEEEA